MHRRLFMFGSAALAATPVFAHHGWSSFNQDQPVYLEGRVKSVRWQNPHAEVVLEVAAGLALPADLAARKLPAQQHGVDAAGIIKKTQVPAAPGGDWEIEFAPLFRMQAWGLAEPLKVGDRIEVIGYTAPSIGKGRLMRVEYLIVGGKAHGLRSLPAT